MQKGKAGALLINAITDSFKDFLSCYSPTGTLPVLTKFLSDSQRVIQDYACNHRPQQRIPSSAPLYYDDPPPYIDHINPWDPDDMIDDDFTAKNNDAFLARYAQNEHEAPLSSIPDPVLDAHGDLRSEPDADVPDAYGAEPDYNNHLLTKDDNIDSFIGDHSTSAGCINNGCEAPESKEPLHLPTASPNSVEIIPESFPCRIVAAANIGHDRNHVINTATSSSARGATTNNNLQVGTDPKDAYSTVLTTSECSRSLVAPVTPEPQRGDLQHQSDLPVEVAASDGNDDTLTRKKSPQRRRKRKSENDPEFRLPKPTKQQLTSRIQTRMQTENRRIDLFVTIPDKTVAPDLIHSILTQRIDAVYHQHLPFLVRLFFYSWSPYALRQIADGCATMRDIVTSENSDGYPSVPGLSKALDKLEFGAPIQRRSYLVQLLEDRQRRESTCLQVKAANYRGSRASKVRTGHEPLKSPGRKLKRCDSKALADMMSEQYPALAANSPDYGSRLKVLQNRLSNAVNWQIAQRRHSSALWMYPCGVKYLSTSE